MRENLLEVNNDINLNETDKKVLKEMKNNPYSTMNEISNKIKSSESNVEKIIKKLKNNNVIKRIGSNKNGYWEVFDII